MSLFTKTVLTLLLLQLMQIGVSQTTELPTCGYYDNSCFTRFVDQHLEYFVDRLKTEGLIPLTIDELGSFEYSWPDLQPSTNLRVKLASVWLDYMKDKHFFASLYGYGWDYRNFLIQDHGLVRTFEVSGVLDAEEIALNGSVNYDFGPRLSVRVDFTINETGYLIPKIAHPSWPSNDIVISDLRNFISSNNPRFLDIIKTWRDSLAYGQISNKLAEHIMPTYQSFLSDIFQQCTYIDILVGKSYCFPGRTTTSRPTLETQSTDTSNTNNPTTLTTTTTQDPTRPTTTTLDPTAPTTSTANTTTTELAEATYQTSTMRTPVFNNTWPFGISDFFGFINIINNNDNTNNIVVNPA